MKQSVGTFRIHAGFTSRASHRALALVALVSLAACGGSSSVATESTLAEGAAAAPTGSTQEASATTGAAVTPELLQFTAPLVGGGEFNGADRAGQATAFWFWAPT